MTNKEEQISFILNRIKLMSKQMNACGIQSFGLPLETYVDRLEKLLKE